MIKLDEQKQSFFGMGISLHNILDWRTRFQPYFHDEHSMQYSHRKQLTLQTHIGNTIFSANALIGYPQLSQSLRQLKTLKYEMTLDLSALPESTHEGIEQTIDAFEKFNIMLLEPHRIKKSVCDAQVNNLVMLHGQHKTAPIYQGAKPYYTLNKTPYNHRATQALQIQLSGVKYYFKVQSNRFKTMKIIYELEEQGLFNPYIEACRAKDIIPVVHYGNRFTCIGGVINTPLLAFRVTQSYKHKGKRYFLDLHTNQVYTRLIDVHALAKSYDKHYKITILENIKK
jgi:hypothetical protein